MADESRTPDLVELTRQADIFNRHDLDAELSDFAPDTGSSCRGWL